MYEDIKRSVTINSVLSHYGIRHPNRAVYRIPCPIHMGRDANFSVSDINGLWNCFSVCGRGGSVIDLVAALERIEPKEAAQKIVNDFRLTPLQASAALARSTSSLVERYKKMKEQTEVELPPTTNLEEGYRGLTKETINYWGLKRTESGVLIPLVNNRGKFCSYSIRRDGEAKPKYIIGPGTSKCMPFGLYQNMQDIISKGFTYVVEAQLDAIVMWQAGYRNVIALQGSHLGETQAMLILSVVGSLVLVMDGDEAGRKAASDIIKRWADVFKIERIDLPDGVDPDEYILKGGRL